MLIERTSREVIIRIPASVNTEELQDVVDFIRYKEITSKFDVSQKEADKLAAQVRKNWWSKNKKRFIAE
jgi:hypothetical protein